MAKKVNSLGFNVATVVQVALIPIISGIIVLSGFYYVTGDALKRHDKDIEILNSTAKVEAKARESVRNEFLTSQQKISDNIAKLDTRLAVSETKQETANQTLMRIADELAKIGNLRAGSK